VRSRSLVRLVEGSTDTFLKFEVEYDDVIMERPSGHCTVAAAAPLLHQSY
jgi:hypothetical protein